MRVGIIQPSRFLNSSSPVKNPISFDGRVEIKPSVSKLVSPTILDKIEEVFYQLHQWAIDKKFSVSVDLVHQLKRLPVLKMTFSNDEDAVNILPYAYKRKPKFDEIALPSEDQIFQTLNMPLAQTKPSSEGMFGLSSSCAETPRAGYIPVQVLSEDVFAQDLFSKVSKCYNRFMSQENTITLN